MGRATGGGATTRRLVHLAATVVILTSAAVVPSAFVAGEQSSTLTDTTVSNPALPDGVVPLGQGRIAERDGRSYLLYAARHTHEPWVQVRELSTGATSHVPLPPGTTGGTAWARADLAVAGDDLWVLSGGGPVRLRHYRLSGDPAPAAAELVDEHVLGDPDSRAGALVASSTGAAVGVWHQHGASGPQGMHFVHATAAGAVTTTTTTGMATRSSTQAVVQHPVDGSIWAFSAADANGAIVAVRLVEAASGLSVTAVDTQFITTDRHGLFGPDPEAPDVEAVSDATTGTVAVAYQSADRKVFSTDPWVVGSRPAVARVGSDGSLSFLALPVHVERTTPLGLSVRGEETWLVHQAVADDGRFDVLGTSRHTGVGWDEPVALGTLADPRSVVYAGRERVAVGGPMADGHLHAFVDGPTGTDNGTVDGASTATTTTSTTKAKGGGNGGGGGGGRKK